MRNISLIRELDERSRGQILKCKLPIPREVFSAMLEDPNVRMWALSMPKSERTEAIQDAINAGLIEVINV